MRNTLFSHCLTTAVEKSSEALIITGLDGKIFYTNPSFEKASGYTREEAQGQHPRILKSGEHDPSFYKRLWKTLVDGEIWRGRIINRRKNGERYQVEATISPIFDQGGKASGYIAIERDINREVILERRLHRVQKMEVLGVLAGGIAHDFNNLLMAVMGQADLCRESLESDHPLQEHLTDILDTMRRSANLSRQLLTFARKQASIPKSIDLNTAIDDMLKLLRRLIGENIQLAFRPGKNLHSIMIDPSQIDQILANLCINARDAIADTGKIVIQTDNLAVRNNSEPLATDLRPGDYVALRVSDSGRGMDATTLARVFEPFFSTKEQGRGTGLGMATVSDIVKRSEGIIDVDSTPGKGTVVTIYFPKSKTALPSPSVSRGKTNLDLVSGNGETVLLVEDEASLRATCNRFLDNLGYRVLPAATPEEALRQADARGHGIDVLLTDVVLPGMNGRQLANVLERDNRGIKVLFMSGYAADEIIPRGITAEGTNFIAKPFSRNELAFKLLEILDPAPDASVLAE